MQLRIHCILLRLLSESITCTLSRCVELLCSASFCAINTRFVWVLPLLLPLPVSSRSDSSLRLRMSAAGERGSWCEGLESQLDSVILAVSPRKGPGPLGSAVHCRTTAFFTITVHTHSKCRLS